MKIKAFLLGIGLYSFSNLLYAQTYYFGVVPQQSPVVLHKKWTPIVNYLSAATGLDIKFQTEKSILEFENQLYSGKYDFAYMNPYHYVMAHKAQGFDAAVRSSKNIRGILVAKQSDTLDSLKPDSKIIFPSPNAFAATLLIKHELLENFGIDLIKTQNFNYVNSHDSVYKGVARGLAPFGGGVQRTFNNFNSTEDKKKIKVVYTTSAYPSHPFAFAQKVKKQDREKLIQALMAMPDDFLKSLSMTSLIPTNDAEYEVVRKLSDRLATK